MRRHIGQWLYDHPLAISWFAMAFCTAFCVWDLIDRHWLAAFGVGLAGAFNAFIMVRARRIHRRLDAEIRRMEDESRERIARMRVERAAARTRNPADL